MRCVSLAPPALFLNVPSRKLWSTDGAQLARARDYTHMQLTIMLLNILNILLHFNGHVKLARAKQGLSARQ